jgi:hypothetical protein
MSLLLVPPPKPIATHWLPNPAWPTFTIPGPTEQKIVGLYAVRPGFGSTKGGNFFAFLAQGNYTIDYGDGTVTNYVSNTQANYEFDFNNPQLSGTDAPVTFSVATNTVNRTAHGLKNGAKIRFYNLIGTTGINSYRLYYVINAAPDNFQVSETAGGGVVDLSGADGSATLLPYKIAVVTITPQPGQNLTVVNFFQKHGSVVVRNGYKTGWLDIEMSIPQCSGTELLISGPGTAPVNHVLLERVNIISVGALTSANSLFSGLRSLQSLPRLPDATALTNTSSMFNSCTSLSVIPPFPGTAASLTDASDMHRLMTAMQEVPALPGSVAALTNASRIYDNNSTLQTIPPLPSSTSSVTNFQSFTSGCPCLQIIPPLDLTSATDTSNFVGNGVTRLRLTNVKRSINMTNQRLSAVALNEVFSGLATVTGQTITVTGNYGINEVGYNHTIATSKGWTVVS